MTTPELALVIVGGSLFASGMTVSAITAACPKWLRVTAPVICRKLEHMELHVGRASYHRPGERGLTITCVSGTGIRPVTLRAFFLPWMALAVFMMIVGALSVLIIKAL